MKTPYKILIALTFSVFCGNAAKAEIHTIVAEGTTFTPSTLTVMVGDTVRWIRNAGSHTTTSTTIPPGATAWDSPLNDANSAFLYIVPVAGTYNYKCTPHQSAGMTGTFTALLTSAPTPVLQDDLVNTTYDNGVLNVTNRSERSVEITVMDLGGRVVRTFDAGTAHSASLYVGDIPKGLYIVNTRTNVATLSRKISIN